jgi:hypothetical protein
MHINEQISQKRQSLLIILIAIEHAMKFNSLSMRLIACGFPVSKANYRWQVKGQHTGARLAIYVKDVLDPVEPTDGCLLGITMDNASSNHLMTHKLQSTLQDSGIKWPALRNHIPCMAHIIQLALGALIGSPSVKGHTKSSEAHERNQQL